MGRVLLAGATVWAGPACVPSRAWMLVEDGRVAALAEQKPLPPVDRVVDRRAVTCCRGSSMCICTCRRPPGFLAAAMGGAGAGWRKRCGRSGRRGTRRRRLRGCCSGTWRGGAGRRAGCRPGASWMRRRPAAGSWSAQVTCIAARSPRPGWRRSGRRRVILGRSSVRTSPAIGADARPGSCGRPRLESLCSGR